MKNIFQIKWCGEKIRSAIKSQFLSFLLCSRSEVTVHQRISAFFKKLILHSKITKSFQTFVIDPKNYTMIIKLLILTDSTFSMRKEFNKKYD